MRFWFRRRASDGKWWSIYIVPGNDEHVVDARATAYASDRRIYLNDDYRSEFDALLLHEWAHVEFWAHRVPGHQNDGTALHLAIDEIAYAHTFRGPPRQAPRLGGR